MAAAYGKTHKKRNDAVSNRVFNSRQNKLLNLEEQKHA